MRDRRGSRRDGPPARARPGIALLAAAVAASAGALSTSPARAQTPESRDAAVRAEFGWPAGLWLAVRLERLEIVEGAGAPDTARTVVTYRLHAAGHPDGRLISISDPAIVSVAPRTGSPAVDSLLALAETVLPAFVVSEAGEFLRIEDPAALRGRVSARFGDALDSLRARAPGLADLAERLTRPGALAAKAAEEWNALVWTWAGREWTPGERRQLRIPETSPLFPGREIPFEYELVTTGRVPCEEGTAARRCVTFRLEAAPDPAVLDELLQAFLESLALEARAEAGGYTELSIRNTVSLVAEPATLLPHALEIEGTIAGRGGNGSAGASEFVRRRVRRFSFDPSSP